MWPSTIVVMLFLENFLGGGVFFARFCSFSSFVPEKSVFFFLQNLGCYQGTDTAALTILSQNFHLFNSEVVEFLL